MASSLLITTLFLLVVAFTTSAPGQPGSCSNVKNNIGYTSPVGDIYLEHLVDPLDLDCIITSPKLLMADPEASSKLSFVYGNVLLDGVTITNGSQIHLHIDADKLKIEKPTYACMFGDDIVCDNVIFVGAKPKPEDFKCISYNNDNLTCTWREPFNSIKTTYTLNYTVQSQPRNVMGCPQNPIPYDSVSGRYKCFWTLSTHPQYRQSSEFYNISFGATNVLGSYHYDLHDFHHFAHIIPNPPERLEVMSATTSSLLLKWGVPPTIQHRQLEYRVMYACGLEMPDRVRDRNFKLAAVRNFTEMATVTYNLRDLPYPHDLCDVRVALRVKLARGDDMWSNNATLYARTAATVPGKGPKVNAGSYKHINDTAVRVYWHQVPAEYENGRNLKYNVTLVDGPGNIVIDRTRPMKNSVVIGNLSSNQKYTFAVYASNDVGPQATPHATITIPAQYQRPYQVRELKKIENTNGFKLQWSPRLGGHIYIENYTVFWCREITKSFNEDCNGDWNWITLGQNQHEYKYEDNSTNFNNTSFRVAIASNSEHGSSGMVFPTCEESGEQIPTINLIKPTQFGDTSVKLSWMVKCTTEGIANYTIEYCIGDQTSYDCRNKTKWREEVDGRVTDFTVGDLTPYATYLFTIYPTMKNGNKGKTSDPERVTTLEGKPTEPSDLESTAVTNSSIALRWKKPSTSNGFITYEIFYNGVKVATNLNETSYVLGNLKSYDLYNISVVACTSNKCSERSNAISLRTQMGVPGRVGQPTAMSTSTPDVVIVWTKPVPQSGPLSYEIQVDDGNVHTYTNKSEMFHYKCVKETSAYTIMVRALNYDDVLNKTYYGEWSDEFKGSCSQNMGWLIPVLILAGLFLIGGVYLGKKGYNHCKKMQDIGVALPKTLQQSNDPSVWPAQKDPNQREMKPPPAADEELLLQSRPEVIKAAYVGDSSGCSSAQGSVTSESEGTFSAASDSGTEQSELRKRSFRNSSKTSLLGAESMGKNENYSQVGLGLGVGMGIETNPLAEMDDLSPKPNICTYMQPYVDAEPVVTSPRPEVQNSSYVTVAQARSMPKPSKEEPVNRPYVQVSDLKTAAQKREPPVDTSRAYVTVGQMPLPSKMNKLYDAKLLKED